MGQRAYIIVVLACVGFACLASPSLYAGQRFGLKPSLRLDALYDNNIFLTPKDEEEGFLGVVTPSLEVDYLLRFGELSGRCAPSLYLPVDQFDDPRLQQFTNDCALQLLSHLTGRIDLTIADNYKTLGADVTKPDYQISSVVDVNVAAIDLAYKLPLAQRTNAAIEVGGDRTDVFDFPSDRWTMDAALDLTREATRRLLLGLRNRAAYILFDSTALQDVIIYGIDARLEYDLTQRVRLIFPVGIQYLEQSRTGGDLAGSFNVELLAQPTERSTLKLAYSQGFTVDVRGSAYEKWEASAAYTAELNSRLKLEIEGRYLNFNLALLSPQDDAVADATMNFTYAATPNLDLIVGGRQFLNRGDFEDDDLDSTQISAGLRYDFYKK